MMMTTLPFSGYLALIVSCLPMCVYSDTIEEGISTSVLFNFFDHSFYFAVRNGSMENDLFALNEAAWGVWNDSYIETGWSTLEIHSNPAFPSDIGAQAAGYFEGFATASRIEQHAVNMGATLPANAELASFIKENNAWIAEKTSPEVISTLTGKERTFWWQVYLVEQQLEGLYNGYKASGAEGNLSMDTFRRLNLYGDLEDLEHIFPDDPSAKQEPLWSDGGACSALIRLLPDNRDVMLSQDTWTKFNKMMRIFKLYDLALSLHGHNEPIVGVGGQEFVASPYPSSKPNQKRRLVPGRASSFSSYPGMLFSSDDFYLLGSGLVVMETTIGYDNEELDELIRPDTVMEWTRNLVANRAGGRGGEHWTSFFPMYNSGTYNNQWMVFDYKLFTPGLPLPEGTFTVLEQIPGMTVSWDASLELEEKGYFASYNVARHPEIRKASGSDTDVANLGPFFGYDSNPRAKIFARDAPKIMDMDGMKRMMRYSDFQNEPFASQADTCAFLGLDPATQCTPDRTSENIIATRGDLNPANGSYALSAFGHRNHASIDSKMSSFATFSPDTLEVQAVCGPPSDPLPAFVWSQSDFGNTSHLGHPDKFDFDWVAVNWGKK